MGAIVAVHGSWFRAPTIHNPRRPELVDDHAEAPFAGPPAAVAYFESGILNYVFGEIWERPGLDQRGRRWITLVGVADSSADTPIRTHVYGAMASGNASFAEMNEFVLQYAIHSGWPRASFVQGVVFDMADKLQKRQTWVGKPLEGEQREQGE